MTEESIAKLKVDGELSVAVVSDLHAYEEVGEARPSFYCIRDEFEETPLGALLPLFDKEALQADILVCPGDLGDKANPAAIREAWLRVHEIGDHLGVHLLAGTVGNHDIDSRYVHNDHDPKGHLQNLKPPFPLPEVDQNDRFWSRNYEIVLHDAYRLVVLNSSAFHGAGQDEFQHGRISNYTLDALKQRLHETENRPVNMLLCHHHPQKHMEINLGDYDDMRSGQLLTDLLGNGEFGEWIIIHGHKHHPKICYAQGGSSAPVVFSSGSLCHVLFDELNTVAQRQFYILRFPFAKYSSTGLVGTFRAWDYEFKYQWGRPTRKSGLPSRGGFGCREKPAVFAAQIAKWLGTRVVPWSEFVDEFPWYEYLLPQDQHALRTTLANEHSINVQSEEEMPVQIGAAS